MIQQKRNDCHFRQKSQFVKARICELFQIFRYDGCANFREISYIPPWVLGACTSARYLTHCTSHTILHTAPRTLSDTLHLAHYLTHCTRTLSYTLHSHTILHTALRTLSYTLHFAHYLTHCTSHTILHTARSGATCFRGANIKSGK
jgi:hypothetical protein